LPQPGRTFRLFVSSTFSDLKEERNALHRTVFPALKKLCEENGFRFQAIDLRWGVREEAGLDQQTMRICLDEVKRCQEVTPRPNFLILLGQRYGWRPLPAEIPADEWQQIEAHLKAQGREGSARIEKLRQWYQLDLNARPNATPPGVWLLKPRTDPPYNDYGTWKREVERPLREILVQATAGLNLPEDAHLKYWASATEQEIDRGALRVRDAPEHVFCFFRTIAGLPENDTAEGFRDLAPGDTPDREADERLEQLKGPHGKLRTKLPEANFVDYEAQWMLPPGQRPAEGQSPVSPTHLEKLCRDVEHALGTVIRSQIAKLTQEDEERKATDLDKEIEQHEGFLKDRTKIFRGREATLRRIADYVAGDDRRPLALIGGPGSGKSAVLAKAVEEARTAHPDASVIFRFIGWTPGSAHVRDLLDKLCRQISPADQPTPSEYRELVQELPKRLKEAGQSKRLLVFLDALDQLSDTDNARNLIWLPMELPPNVRLVVSTSTEPGDTEAVLKRRLAEQCRFPLDDMPVEEAHDLLGMWCDDPTVGRTLQGRAETVARCGGQWKLVLDRFAGCRRPLYLKLAFEEARRWRSFDDVKDLRLAADIPTLIEQLYDRLSSPANHGATIVSRSLGYLAAGKNGLTEDELIDVLSRDPQVLEEVRKFHRPPEEKLPVVIWSRLYFDLEPYLTQRSADETTLLAFYHRQLDLVARRKYLEPFKTARHRTLAEFFGDEQQKLFLGEGETRRANIRKLSELPYQQTYAGDKANPGDEMWTKLYATLTDFEFLEAKCTYLAVTSESAGENARKVYNGVYELQEDYRRALDVFPVEEAPAPATTPRP
jgi:hypothetical protein